MKRLLSKQACAIGVIGDKKSVALFLIARLWPLMIAAGLAASAAVALLVWLFLKRG